MTNLHKIWLFLIIISSILSDCWRWPLTPNPTCVCCSSVFNSRRNNCQLLRLQMQMIGLHLTAKLPFGNLPVFLPSFLPAHPPACLSALCLCSLESSPCPPAWKSKGGKTGDGANNGEAGCQCRNLLRTPQVERVATRTAYASDTVAAQAGGGSRQAAVH